MKTLIKVVTASVACALVLGFASEVDDIDAEKILTAEQKLLQQQIEQQRGEKIDDEEVLIIDQALKELRKNIAEINSGLTSGFCLANEKCNDLYPEPPVLCHTQNNNEEICNRSGEYLQVEK